jgi:hypothetical protein
MRSAQEIQGSRLQVVNVYVSEPEDQWGTWQLGPDFNPKKRRW